MDLVNVPLLQDPRTQIQTWERIEQEFGIGERSKDDPFRLYTGIHFHGPVMAGWGQPRHPIGSRAELVEHRDAGMAETPPSTLIYAI